MTLAALFERHGLSAHLTAFEAEHVALEDLAGISDAELRETFGVVSFGDRKRFRAMVAELTGEGATPPIPDVASLSGATTLGDVSSPGPSLTGPTSVSPGLSLEGATRGLTVMGRSVSPASLDLAALPAGTVFDGRYTIVDLLGRGGMGAVYQAVDRDTKSLVALKTLPVGEARLLEGLANEAQLASRLQHPNLLAIRHLETRGESPYVVMELMDDGDLESMLRSRGGRLEARETMRLLDGVLSGLEALHGEKMAHLDVKPANVLLGKDGRVKLADFGISSRMRDQRGGSSGAATLEYAPPEQVRGEPCDARADIYAAGMLAHVMLTGGFPFEGRDPAVVRAWHDTGPRTFPGVDAPVGQVLARALAVRPADRFRSAEELRQALRGALGGNNADNAGANGPRAIEVLSQQLEKIANEVRARYDANPFSNTMSGIKGLNPMNMSLDIATSQASFIATFPLPRGQAELLELLTLAMTEATREHAPREHPTVPAPSERLIPAWHAKAIQLIETARLLKLEESGLDAAEQRLQSMQSVRRQERRWRTLTHPLTILVVMFILVSMFACGSLGLTAAASGP